MTGPSAPPTVFRRLPALGAWWHGPQGALVAVALAAALLFLRKPWALHTPQLYAEDGSIFLVGHETLGLHNKPGRYVAASKHREVVKRAADRSDDAYQAPFLVYDASP